MVGQSEVKKENRSEALRDPDHWWTLIGTAGTWFFFDVAFYGTVIFSPTILAHIFGPGASLMDICLKASFLGGLAIVGTLTGIRALSSVGPKALSVGGLTLAALIFSALLAVVHLLPDCKYLMFALLCSLYFVLYAFPNLATYVQPVVSFPPEVRSTFHGLSSAAAKLGAMAGALLFPIVDRHLGLSAVLAIQAVVCASGALVAYIFLESQEGEDNVSEDVKSSWSNLPQEGDDVELSWVADKT
ncbi:unnamed protein product [Polarella glacialis]|uniref:Major facilitator superfamily (MFS) profile domain-containing protein n=1 Tax=Polarella glacialis TaxID=89957 RepID=A0A813I4W1_POLGL|nr:unnamed protein product [Polarella glacialis]